MDFLLQANQSGGSVTPVISIGGMLSIVAGIAGAVIVSRKGHSTYYVVMHALSALLCIGWIGLISALLMKDLTLENLKQRAAQEEAARRQQGLAAALGAAPPAAAPHASHQTTCPRCGSFNHVNQRQCWHCGVALIPGAPVPSQVEPDDSKPASMGTRQRKRMEEYEHLAASVSPQLRVECLNCRKHFSGRQTKLDALKKCPKCGAYPFRYRVLSAENGQT